MSDHDRPGDATLDIPRDEGPGGWIGPFRIVRSIGEGGFGSVFEAEQEQPVKRLVALKVIKLGMDTREVIARFEAERQALAMMDHPHIARVLDAGSTDSGRPYFVMELVRGEPIARFCRSNGLSIEQRLELFEQVCAAVQHAHSQGVIHRDLKPSNVLVSMQDDAPFAKVIDFGIAKAIRGRLTDRTLLTERDAMVGTPLYMSPEQAEGRADIDARTDVYSLGVILYELLTDSTPFDLDTLRGAAYGEIQRIIREVEPPRPSDRLSGAATTQRGAVAVQGAESRRWARTVRGDLDWIVMKAIEKERARRYETASALASDVRRYLAHEPVLAAPPGAARRLRRFVHRHKGRLVAGSLVALSLLVVFLAVDKFVLAPRRGAQDAGAAAPGADQTAQAIDAKSVAVLPFANLSDDKSTDYFASGMQDMILTRLSAIGELRVISRTSTQKYGSRPDDLKTIARQLGVATVLEGSVQKSGNEVLINVQLIDARTDAHLWAEAYPRTLDNLFGVEGEVAQAVADALKTRLTPAEARLVNAVPTHDREAFDLFLRANALHFPVYVQFALAGTKLPPAIALYQQALAKDPKFAECASVMARAHMLMYWAGGDRTPARLASAKAAAEQALALNPDLGDGHFALGLYWYWGHRDYARAQQEFDLARRTMPNSPRLEAYSGYVARREGRWDDAIAHIRRAVSLDPRAYGILEELAASYVVLRRYGEADAALARAETLVADPVDEQVMRGLFTVLWKGDLSALHVALGGVAPGSENEAANVLNAFKYDWWSRDFAAAAVVANKDAAENWDDAAFSDIVLPRRLYLAWAYQAAGDEAKARPLYEAVRAQVQAALRQRPESADLHLALGFAAAGLRMKDEAITEGLRATELMPVARDTLSGPSYQALLANLYVRVGENEKALVVLRQVLAMPTGGGALSPALLELDPAWDPIRKDPRFLDLVAHR